MKTNQLEHLRNIPNAITRQRISVGKHIAVSTFVVSALLAVETAGFHAKQATQSGQVKRTHSLMEQSHVDIDPNQTNQTQPLHAKEH